MVQSEGFKIFSLVKFQQCFSALWIVDQLILLTDSCELGVALAHLFVNECKLQHLGQHRLPRFHRRRTFCDQPQPVTRPHPSLDHELIVLA